jgi:AcrR family transcriptional regulator
MAVQFSCDFLDGGARRVDHPGMTRATTGARPRPDKNEVTRRRLLGAALKVVGRHGYAGTSIGRVTRRARVALGTFYSHFGSQQDLFDQMLPHLGEQLLSAIRLRLAGVTDTREREAAGFDTFFEFLAEYPEFYRVLNEAEIFAPRAHAAHVDNMLQGYLRAFRHASARGELAAFSDEEFEPVIYMLLGARQYLAMRYPSQGGEPPGRPPPAVREAYLKVFTGGLLSRDHGQAVSSGGAAPSRMADIAPRSGGSGAEAAALPVLGTVRFSGAGAHRKARAAFQAGKGAEPGAMLLAAMDRLARHLLGDLATSASQAGDSVAPVWADVHFQRLVGEAAFATGAELRLAATPRGDGALVEVTAHDPGRRLLAICAFRPDRAPGGPSSAEGGRSFLASDHDDSDR